MQEGDFVYIDYVGRIKDTGEIFDLTKEEIAKKEKIFNPNIKYKPIPVIIGAGLVLKGIETALKKMNIGEKKKVEIPPEEGFGQRNPDFVKLLPISIFKDRNITIEPGSYVTVNGIPGKVLSISGGRVKIDFNHPLAGKSLIYEIEIKEEIKTKEEKVKAIISYFFELEKGNFTVEIKEKEAEIILNKKINYTISLKERIASILMEWVGLEKIKFVEIYTK